MTKNIYKSALIIGIILIIGGGSVLAMTNFWRFMQQGTRYSFLYGGDQNDTAQEFLTLLEDGRVGLGTHQPLASALLELVSANRGLLLPRVPSVASSVVTAPADGMMVYDESESCFKVYQGGSWGLCVHQARGVKMVPSITGLSGGEGDIVYDTTDDQLYVSNGSGWLALGGFEVTIQATPPAPSVSREGDLFFSSVRKDFFVFDGSTWVRMSLDFERFVVSRKDCRLSQIQPFESSLSCKPQEHMGGLYLESATGTDAIDQLNTAEVLAVECCRSVIDDYYWHTYTWSTCEQGNAVQTRDVVCKAQDGTDAPSDDHCLGIPEPIDQRDCPY